MFERFTQAAIKTIMLAQEECRRLGHNCVSSEHLLLGLLRLDSEPAVKALNTSGLKLKEARIELEKARGRGKGPLKVEIPFTDEAKRTLEASWDAAQSHGHNYIGAEHLLLAVLRKKDCDAMKILEALGANLGQLEEQVLDSI